MSEMGGRNSYQTATHTECSAPELSIIVPCIMGQRRWAAVWRRS